jgi:hypothetical protein
VDIAIAEDRPSHKLRIIPRPTVAASSCFRKNVE